MVHIPDWVHPCSNRLNWVFEMKAQEVNRTPSRQRKREPCWLLNNHNLFYSYKWQNGELFSMFQKTLFHFFSDDIFAKWTSLIDSKHLFLDNICRYFQSEKVKIRKTKVKERRNHLISFFWAAQYTIEIELIIYIVLY